MKWLLDIECCQQDTQDQAPHVELLTDALAHIFTKLMRDWNFGLIVYDDVMSDVINSKIQMNAHIPMKHICTKFNYNTFIYFSVMAKKLCEEIPFYT